MILALSVIALLFLSGCGDSTAEVRRKIAGELSQVSLVSKADAIAAMEHCQAAARLMLSLDGQEREEALSTWPDHLRRARFNESSYGGRLESLERYVSLVDTAFASLDASIGDKDMLWMFRLDALRRMADELKKCDAEPKGGPYTDIPQAESFMTQRNYRETLRSRQFDVIQSRFETGPFAMYFKGLDAGSKSNWIARIEAVADRKIVVFDPEKPFEPLPRYIPKDEREWVTTSGEASKSREYIEHIGSGKTIRMHETQRTE